MNPPKDLVQAYFFGSPKKVGEKILFIKRDKRLEEYKEYLTDLEMFGNVWRGMTGKLYGEPVSVIATGVGPSLIGDAVSALDRPGVDCLYSGTCGGLDDGLDIGDYFLADQAVCGDGYTLHLGHAPFSMVHGDPGVLQALKAALTTAVGRLDAGVTFTTCSVVRETNKGFWRDVDKQCRIIEMAAAAFYAAALTTGKKAAAYFWVTDLPTKGKSFFDRLLPEDVQIKEERYNRAVSLDMTLLSRL